MIYNDGGYYKGEFKGDQANGYGTYVSNKNGTVYEGYWVNDKQEGIGKETFQDVGFYKGEYVNGKKLG